MTRNRTRHYVSFIALSASIVIASIAVIALAQTGIVSAASSPIRATSTAATSAFLLPAPTYDSGGPYPISMAIADLDGDGNLDVVVGNANSDRVGVLLGNGHGWFGAPQTYPAGTRQPRSVAIGDVNKDGKPDIVVATGEINNCGVGVLLGNGDGTFQPTVTYGSSAVCQASSVVLADFNGDGNLDIAVSNFGISVLMGNGDGSFQPAARYSWGTGEGTSWGANSLAAADVNGDGKPDLLAATGCINYPFGSGTVGVLLNKGDGTFKPAVDYQLDGYTFSMAVGDLNKDGKPDLVVASFYNSEVEVLLGNGDGTFQPAVAYVTGGFTARSVAIADMNGDGKPDLVVAYGYGSSDGSRGAVFVLPGNGDGTFPSWTSYHPGGRYTFGAAAADVNGDGQPDLVVNQTGSGSDAGHGTVGILLANTGITTKTVVTTSGSPSLALQPVTFTATVTSAYGSIPNGELVAFYDGLTFLGVADVASGRAMYTTSGLAAKSHLIQATYIGDSAFPTSYGRVHQTVNGLPTTTTVISSPNPSTYGQSVTFTATVTSAGPTPTGKIKFIDGATLLGAPALSGGVAMISRSKLAVGTHTITAQYSGDAVSGKSTSSVLNQEVQ